MMKWPRSRKSENEGLLYVQEIINSHGSIFRRTHQEEDVGLDGTIEFVLDEQVQGLLIAIQVKSGVTYERADRMVVPTDQRHMNYWRSFMLPVVVIAYSPSRRAAYWTHIQRAAGPLAATTSPTPAAAPADAYVVIDIPFSQEFDTHSMRHALPRLARTVRDRAELYAAATNVVSDDPDLRYQGLFLLTQHPESDMSRLTVQLALSSLLDSDSRIVRLATQLLGRALSQTRWERHYANHNLDTELFARRACFGLTHGHIRNILAAVPDGDFGRASVGEAALYCLSFASNGQAICRDLVLSEAESMVIRATALAVFYAGDWDALLADADRLAADGLSPILEWLRAGGQAADSTSRALDANGNEVRFNEQSKEA